MNHVYIEVYRVTYTLDPYQASEGEGVYPHHPQEGEGAEVEGGTSLRPYQEVEVGEGEEPQGGSFPHQEEERGQKGSQAQVDQEM